MKLIRTYIRPGSRTIRLEPLNPYKLDTEGLKIYSFIWGAPQFYITTLRGIYVHKRISRGEWIRCN